MTSNSYSPAWPHSAIQTVFPEIFFVMGTNITHHDGLDYQHSRNMVIIRDQGRLSLINTVRLTEEGLAELDALGSVKNVIRIGAFHGRDDAFYLDRYAADLWAMEGMQHADNRQADHLLKVNARMPFKDAVFLPFETSRQPEGLLHLTSNDGIIITCDSIKNWVTADPFFSEESAKRYQAQGAFGVATISDVWKNACAVHADDFKRLTSLKFKHLLSAHGEPLLQQAHEAVKLSVQQAFQD